MKRSDKTHADPILSFQDGHLASATIRGILPYYTCVFTCLATAQEKIKLPSMKGLAIQIRSSYHCESSASVH